MPPRWNGQPGAQDQAQVDVLRLGDHPLVEHQPHLLGQRVERSLAYLLGGQRLIADLEPGGDLGIDGVVDQQWATGVGDPLEVLADREPVRERRVQGATDVVRHCRTDQLQQGQRSHRQAQRVQRRIGHLQRGAGVHRGEDLTEEAGQ